MVFFVQLNDNFAKLAKRIFLWSAPRVCSTAFLRSVSQLKGVQTYHEPYIEPYYFGDDRICDRFDRMLNTEKYDSVRNQKRI